MQILGLQPRISNFVLTVRHNNFGNKIHTFFFQSMSPKKLSTPSTLTKTPESKETFKDILISYDENKNHDLGEKTVFDDQGLKKTLGQQNR